MNSQIRLFGKSFSAFQTMGLIGFLTGFALALCVAILKMPSLVFVLLLLLPLSFGGMYLLAWLQKMIKGKEELVFYHHMLLFLLEAVLLMQLSSNKDLLGLDIMILGFSVFAGFGRLGCYQNGCCHGVPHSMGVPYSSSFIRSSFPSYLIDVPVLAVQILESTGVFMLVLCQLLLIGFGAKSGYGFLLFFSGYPVLRFYLEFLRGDIGRPFFYGFSEAQWTSLLLTIALSVAMLMLKISILFPFTALVIILLGMASEIIVQSRFSAAIRQLRKPENRVEIYQSIRNAFDHAKNQEGVLVQKFYSMSEIDLSISISKRKQHNFVTYSFSLRKIEMSHLDATYLQRIITSYRQNNSASNLSSRLIGVWTLEMEDQDD